MLLNDIGDAKIAGLVTTGNALQELLNDYFTNDLSTKL